MATGLPGAGTRIGAAPPVPPVPPGPPEKRATRITFFIAGFGTAAWAPLVPYAKARFDLDAGTLGLLLLCLGAGSVAAMPVAGMLTARRGCRVIVFAASAMLCLTLPMLATVTSLPLFVAALLVFGAAVGAVDCVMNIQGIIVERSAGRPMMSGFHGLYSAGGILGASGVSGLLSLGAPPSLAALSAVAGIVLALIWARGRFLSYGADVPGRAFGFPRGIVLVIGLLCFVMFLTEGSALDWSAVFLTSARGVNPGLAGIGFAAFSLTMTLGRLVGDGVVRRIGPRQVVTMGSLIAAGGLALAAIVPSWEVGVLGYALLGTGCSSVVPVFYAALGRQKVMPESLAVPAVTTMGYAGIVAGPAAIGFVAHASSLPSALLIVAALLVGVAAIGRTLPL
jgi:MFS family permease